MINLTGLWRSETKNGREYWSGIMGGVKIIMFRNNSTNSKAPEFNLCIDQYQKKEQQQQEEPQGNTSNKQGYDFQDSDPF